MLAYLGSITGLIGILGSSIVFSYTNAFYFYYKNVAPPVVKLIDARVIAGSDYRMSFVNIGENDVEIQSVTFSWSEGQLTTQVERSLTAHNVLAMSDRLAHTPDFHFIFNPSGTMTSFVKEHAVQQYVAGSPGCIIAAYVTQDNASKLDMERYQRTYGQRMVLSEAKATVHFVSANNGKGYESDSQILVSFAVNSAVNCDIGPPD